MARRESPDPASKEKVSFLTEFEARLVVRDPGTGRATVSDPFSASGAPGPPTVGPDGGVLCPVFFGQAGYLFAARPGSPRVERVWPRAAPAPRTTWDTGSRPRRTASASPPGGTTTP